MDHSNTTNTAMKCRVTILVLTTLTFSWLEAELVLVGVGVGVASMGEVFAGDKDKVATENINGEYKVAKQVGER